MNRVKLKDGVTVLASVLLLMLPLVLAGWYIVQRHGIAQNQIDELEPRYARLAGLERQRDEMAAAQSRVESARVQYVYPASQDATQAGNAAQQRLRDILTNAGLLVSSSQVLPAKLEKGFDRILLTVRAEGDLLALQTTLSVLSSQTPVILIDELEVQVIGGLGNAAPRVAPKLGVQFIFSVFRERS